MKSFIFTLAMVSGLLSAQAQYGYQQTNYYQNNYNNQSAILNISTFNNSVISVLIDGQVRSNTGSNVQINFATAGSHQLYITGQTYNYPYGNQQVVLFNGYVNILAGTSMNGVIDQWGRLNMSQAAYQNTGYNNGYNNCNNGSNRNAGRGRYCRNNNNNCGNGYNTNYNTGGYQQNYYNAFMSNDQFALLKQTISSKSFDSSKQQVANQAINSNNLSAAQVAELLKLFSFESTKLEVAKAAYLRSTDRANFYQVNNAFTFSSSISEMDQFIATHS